MCVCESNFIEGGEIETGIARSRKSGEGFALLPFFSIAIAW